MLRPMSMRPVSALVGAVLVVLGTGCSGNDSKTVDVTGDFVMSGGPYAGSGPRSRSAPLSGTVLLESSKTTLRVEVGKSGHFKVRVTPGRYEVTGTSPHIQGGLAPCGQGTFLDAQLGVVNHVQVSCNVA